MDTRHPYYVVPALIWYGVLLVVFGYLAAVLITESWSLRLWVA